ncbi:MAG: family 78 glycoside hydrolase catalytic domain [Firmicutes bacterium]|nr:family 78 glycoside hydrolase catalytic domain [Bacillota bacterium]
MTNTQVCSPQAPVQLRCEYVQNPLGIDRLNPRLSWVLQHSEPNQYQRAYQVIVADDEALIAKEEGNIWDSGKVECSRSVNIVYAGKELESCRRYYWRVRWWDQEDGVSPYSCINVFETGFLRDEEWTASWIANGDDALPDAVVVDKTEYNLRPGSLLRKEFSLDKEVARARAYISGLGYYELRINGKKIGDRVLDPGQTDYRKTILYSVYDITCNLKQGANAVGVMLGNGRYCSFHWMEGKLYGYDAFPCLRAELHITYTDGSQDRIVTDTTWQVNRGPVGANGIYLGEVYDARKEIPGWDQPGLDAAGWAQAVKVEPPGGRMRAQIMPPIKITKRFQPAAIYNPDPGVYIYDFGQNITGWVRLKVEGPRGAEVKLRFAETLDDRGRLNTCINRSAEATDIYILKGEGVEIYEPRFTYHGFRYVEVTGYPGTPGLDALEACFLHTAVEYTGGFASSHQLFNKIHQNVVYGQLANLMSVPTDCPQRDERMGWMGDAQLVVEEAIYNFDMAAFYVKYLQDIKDAQMEDGQLSDVVPPYWPLYPADPAWGTAYITIAWAMYRYYGDLEVLKEHYEGMKKYVKFLESQEKDGLVTFVKYGEWCPPGSVQPKKNPREMTSAFYYYHDVLRLSQIAEVIGKNEDAEYFRKKAEDIRTAFNEKYFHPKRKAYGNNDQTSNILGLQFGLTPEGMTEAVAKNLVGSIIREADYHFDTGIIGTRYMLDTLTDLGYKEVAYRMMAQESYPSLGYMIKEGATTVWERWEKLTGTGMNSHNHIMLGSVDTWFYRALAGIRLGEPGWSKVVIKPAIPAALDHASASVKTLKGQIASSWSRDKSGFEMKVTIPVNTKAVIYVPKLDYSTLTGTVNGVPIAAEAFKLVTESGEAYYRYEGGSGCYLFGLK